MKFLFLILSISFIGCSVQKDYNTLFNDDLSVNKIDSSLVDSISYKEDSILLEDTLSLAFSKTIRSEESTQISVQKETVVIESKSNKKITSSNDLGQVIYKVPDTMKVMKNYEVIVRISKSSNNVEITSDLNGKIFSKNIKTSNKMQVELIDPTSSCFNIKEINSQKQLVDSTYTEWKFNVVPLKSGQNKLDLVISIIRGDDVKQVVYSDEIYVQSNAPAQIKTFWFENWQWSMEKLIIPILTWFFGMWWGKRTEKKKKKD